MFTQIIKHQRNILTICGLATASACGGIIDVEKSAALNTFDSPTENPLAVRSEMAQYFCLQGLTYNGEYRFCEGADRAMGPFPEAMIEECRVRNGGFSCDLNSWNLELAGRVRGSGDCPLGTTREGQGICVEGDFAYGPFTVGQYNRCKEKGGGQICESQRWPKEWVTPGEFVTAPTPTPAEIKTGAPSTKSLKIRPKSSSGSGTDFYHFYASDYSRIGQDVLTFHKGGKKWGCAAYVSAALRLFGIPIVPKLTTTELEKELMRLGWQRVSLNNLQVGDVVFTSKAGSNIAGTYAHVFVHGGYAGNNRYSWAIDNNSKRYKRNIYAGSRTPASHAWRLPQ